jgi:hypothetical protein
MEKINGSYKCILILTIVETRTSGEVVLNMSFFVMVFLLHGDLNENPSEVTH